jgi:hypothetical protein
LWQSLRHAAGGNQTFPGKLLKPVATRVHVSPFRLVQVIANTLAVLDDHVTGTRSEDSTSPDIWIARSLPLVTTGA